MEKDLEQRTKQFSLAIIALADTLPKTRTADVLARQLLRSATSVGANYREANRGVSRADFANKIGTVQKEASETQYWIELLAESSICAENGANRFAQGSLGVARDLHRDRKKAQRMRIPVFYFLLSTF